MRKSICSNTRCSQFRGKTKLKLNQAYKLQSWILQWKWKLIQ